MRRFLTALVLLSLQTAFAPAQDQWREVRGDAFGFVVSMPQDPTYTSRIIGTSKATQTNFLIENGQITYLLSVIQTEKGTVPKNPDRAYFQNLMKNYVEGSTTTLRTSKLATIAGKPGIDGIADAGDSAHQVQILVSGDRVYMVIYVGPKGQENSADPVHFRGSFKLIR
jgi:hypothetical protein